MYTGNKFFVGVQGDSIVFIRPLPTKMLKEDALNLAVWLVTLADEDMGQPGGKFQKLLQEVINT